VLDRAIAEATVDDPAVRRLLTIAGVNLTVAAGLVAAIGDIRRFPSPQQLVSYFGLTRGSGSPGSAWPSMAGSARSAGRTRGRC
jgi:transposase